MKKTAIRLGTWGAGLGMLAGLVELSLGTHIRPWIGDKEHPVVLGLVTLFLSGLALSATIFAYKREAPTRNGQLTIVLGVLLPATICFTTVGRLWYLPGSLLLASAALLAAEFWMAPRPAVSSATNGRAWRLGAGMGSLVLLVSIGLAFWQSAFGLFQAEIPERADRLRVEVMPMDFVRRTSFTNGVGLAENFESNQVRIVYICLILGAGLALSASLVSSRLFAGIGSGVVMLGLVLFLVWMPGIMAAIQIASGYPGLLKSLGWGCYLAITSLDMILGGVISKPVK